MTSKTTSNSGKTSISRQIRRNNDLIKGNMKMNAELIEAISQLTNAVSGIGTKNDEKDSSDSAAETATLPVHLYMLLDRSGSMSGWQNDVIGGFNSFIKEQQSEKDECAVTLVQFDGQDPYEKILEAEKLESVQELDASVYSPRGNTPLLDALGRLIKSAEKRNTKTPEDVLVWVFTDGLENASQEFTSTQIKELVEEKEKEGWTFMFMGAGIDSYAISNDLGFAERNTSHFVKSADGIDAAFSQSARSMHSYRSKTQEDRLAQKDDMWEGIREAEDLL
ncbi:MAG: vWA domain-containing protein [Actinomycetota bacterium]